MKKLDSIIIGLSIVAAATVLTYGFKPADKDNPIYHSGSVIGGMEEQPTLH